MFNATISSDVRGRYSKTLHLENKLFVQIFVVGTYLSTKIGTEFPPLGRYYTALSASNTYIEMNTQ